MNILIRTTALWSVWFLFAPVGVRAQSLNLPAGSIGSGTVGDRADEGLGQVMSGIREGRQNMADFNQKVAAARARYFALVPDKPGVEEAGAEFYALLQAKDIGLISEQIMVDIQKSLLGNLSNASEMAEIVGGKSRWDGGLAPVLRPAFDTWMRSATARQNESPLGWLDSLAGLGDIFDEPSPEYQRYRRIRDWNEYYNAEQTMLYFGSPESYVHFMIQFFMSESPLGLPDEEVAEIYDGLLDRYGKSAVLKAAEKLMSARPSRYLTINDRKAIGLPDWAGPSSQALMFLLAESADNEGFALAYLSGSDLSPRLEDGASRFRAMVEQHGAQTVEAGIAAIRKAEMDERGRLTLQDYQGMSRHQALLAALPLDPDPVLVALRAAQEEQDRLYAEHKAERLAQLEARGLLLAEGHLDTFLRARELAERIDLHHMATHNAKRRPDEPPLVDYRTFRDDIDAMAGLWNEFLETGETEPGKMASRYPKSFGKYSSAEIYNELRALLKFVDGWNRLDIRNTPSLTQVQSKRIAEGRLPPERALSLAHSSWREAIDQRLESLRSGASNNQRKGYLGIDATIFEKLIAFYENKLEGPTLRPGQTATEQLAEERLRHIRLACELADIADAVALEDVNKKRSSASLEPLEYWPTAKLYVVAAAGLWDGYLATQETAYLNAARKALSDASRLDQTFREGAFVLDFIGERPDPDALQPVPPSVIQQAEIEAGRMNADDAINFDTTPEIFAKILELETKRRALNKILGVSYGSRPDADTRKHADAKAAMAEIEAIQQAIDALDAAHGHSSRFVKP